MANPDTDAIAPDIEEPSPAELAPALTVAYGLTKLEQVLTGLVCRGFRPRLPESSSDPLLRRTPRCRVLVI